MQLKKFFFLIFLLSITIVLGQQKPNIVYINIDDLGWSDLSSYGSDYYETPNIDKLVSNGMMFTNAYASASNCAPSRAGLFTGQYSPRHGIYTVNNSDRGKAIHRKLIPTPNTTTLHDSIITIADVLNQKGYLTASMGKWHLGETPESQGFDINIGGTHDGHPKSYFSPYKNKNLSDGPEGEYLTDRLTNEAISFLNKNYNTSFFLYMTYYTVHTPIQGKPELIEKYKAKKTTKAHSNPTYGAMVEAMDQNIGRLIETIENLGLSSNTLIIFTSDNGGLFTVSKQLPLRAGKGSYYEGGIRVPFIVRWDNKITANSVSHTPINNIDIYPTILELLALDKPKNHPLDGVSLLPLFNNEKTNKARPLFWHFPVYLQSVINDPAEGRDPYFRTRPGSVIRYGEWKLHHYFEDNEVELYNLKTDPSEQNNLANNFPEKKTALMNMLNRWRSNIAAPIPTKMNPKYKKTD
jgi:arylsulfatase A-like enzyme